MAAAFAVALCVQGRGAMHELGDRTMHERFQVGKKVIHEADEHDSAGGTIIGVNRIADGEIVSVIVEWEEPEARERTTLKLDVEHFTHERGFYLEDEWRAAYEVVCERLHAEWEAHRSGDAEAIERAADYLVRVSRGEFTDEAQRH